MLHGVLATCRSGFEKECVAELSECAAQAGLTGYPQTKPDSGFCVFNFHEPVGERVFSQFEWKSLVFARSVFVLRNPPCESVMTIELRLFWRALLNGQSPCRNFLDLSLSRRIQMQGVSCLLSVNRSQSLSGQR